MLPSVVVVEESRPDRFPDDLTLLTPLEAASMARAVPKRRREYTAGRVLARRAAARLGVSPLELLAGDDRAPQWPDGLVGSITHTQDHVAVALARSEDIGGIGLDVEQAAPLPIRLWDSICTPEDLAMLSHYGDELERGLAAKVVFSAKEAAYKAQYLITQQFLGFSAMHIRLEPEANRFVATFRQPAGEAYRAGDELVGQYIRSGPLLASCVVIDYR